VKKKEYINYHLEKESKHKKSHPDFIIRMTLSFLRS
jgi:hypothetical protein